MDWRPFFLRADTPPEGWPLPAHVREQLKDPNHPVNLRAKAAGLKMVQREIIPSTRRAHEATEYARAQGKIDPFRAALLRRYWSEGQSLWEWSTLRGAAEEAGLDPDETQRAVEEGRYRTVVEEAFRQAHAMGVNSVPTYVLADQIVIQGSQNYSVFKNAMERLGAQPRGQG